MKKIFFILLALLLLSPTVVVAAPYYTSQRSLLPIDSTENIGTTTNPWDIGFFNQVCLSGDCKTAWPTGGSGGGSGNSAWTIGNGVIYNATSTDNVGVGTSSPFAKLSVGTHNLAITSPSFLIASSSTGVPTTTLMAMVNGRLGLGTPNPSQIIDVVTTGVGLLQLTADSDNLTESDTSGIQGSQDGGVSTWNVRLDDNNNFILGANSTTQPNMCWALSSVGTTYMTIADCKMILLNGGNAGIGTTSPWGRLSVSMASPAATDFTPFFVVSSTTSATSAPIFKIDNSTTTMTTGLNVANGSLTVSKETGSTTIPQLNIGNLLFNTNAGLVNFIDMPVDSGASSGTVMGYDFLLGGSTTLSFRGVMGANGYLNSTSTLVGFGTSSPQVQLDVWGAFGARLNATSSALMTCNSSYLEGFMFWNLSNHRLWVCNSSNAWSAIY